MSSMVYKLRKQHNRQKGECTWCGARVTGRRRSWCSEACVHAYRMKHDWQYIRGQVEERDGGVCAICCTDTFAQQRLIRRLKKAGALGWQALKELQVRHDFPHLWRAPWECDHITPRADGGTDDLDNLRTLCIPCHKAVTADFAAERARRRREAS